MPVTAEIIKNYLDQTELAEQKSGGYGSETKGETFACLDLLDAQLEVLMATATDSAETAALAELVRVLEGRPRNTKQLLKVLSLYGSFEKISQIVCEWLQRAHSSATVESQLQFIKVAHYFSVLISNDLQAPASGIKQQVKKQFSNKIADFERWQTLCKQRYGSLQPAETTDDTEKSKVSLNIDYQKLLTIYAALAQFNQHARSINPARKCATKALLNLTIFNEFYSGRKLCEPTPNTLSCS